LAQPSGAILKPFRHARLWLASLIAVLLGAAVATFVVWNPYGRAVELLTGDLFRKACPLPASTAEATDVPATVFAIDDSAIQRFGHWPWPWTRMAEVVDLLHELDARLVFLDIEFLEPDPPRIAQETAPDGRVADTIVHTVPELVAAVRRSGNVLLPFSLYFADRPTAGGEAGRLGSHFDATQVTARAEALRILEARCAVGLRPDEVPGLCRVETLQPMIADLARVCAGSGYASILKDPEDGVVRRIALLARTDDHVYPHLALTAAGRWRFGPDYRVRLASRRLVLESADGSQSVSVAVDDRAQLNLRWPPSVESLDCLAVGPLLELADRRAHYRSVMRQLDLLFPEAGWTAVDEQLRGDRALRDAARSGACDRSDFSGPEIPSDEELRALEQRRLAIENDLVMDLNSGASDAAETGAQDARSRRLVDLQHTQLEFLASYHEKVEERLKYLRPHVAGHFCLVGQFATGSTDLQRTPLAKDQPGVTVYPAAVRTILSGIAFRSPAPWQAWAAAVLAAWLVALATVHLSTLRGVAAVLVMAGLIVAAAWMTAAQAAVLLPVAGPVLAVVVAFAGVSGYRQLTEASSRRFITRVFQQYNSADLVDEIVRHPDRLRLGGERRDVTILFSDIQGFTPLSERLEPERLVTLLNRYLSVMTTLFQAERGTLDKYVGDGIMAFFGAPVAVPDHALRAVRAALAMQSAMPEVNRDLLAGGLLPPDARLVMRIGCSTGAAIVGNFGSEQRFNYTCSGDTVNLGARLEEANRWLGSRILVSEATRAACGQAILFRPLGPVRIRGKAQPITGYEPLAPEPAPESLRQLAEVYGRAIAALVAGDLAAADAAVADLMAAHPDDPPTHALRERIEAVRSGRTDVREAWNFAKPKG